MDFSGIPKVVYERNLLPLLKWNDLLRLRRVCTATRDVVNAYLNSAGALHRAPEIEINEGDLNFSEFLRMSIPTARIFLNNLSGDKFYEEAGQDGDIFLERFGPLVKSLRVNQISRFMCGKEWGFLEALVNLENFEADKFGGWDGRQVNSNEILQILREKHRRALEDPRVFHEERFPVPATLKQLKSIKIGNNEDFQFQDILKFTEEILAANKSLEFAALPFNMKTSPVEAGPFSGNLMPGYNRHPRALAFILVKMSIIERRDKEPPADNLKKFDFVNYHDDNDRLEMGNMFLDSPGFLPLSGIACDCRVKLQNVASYWFLAWNSLSDVYSVGPLAMDVGSAVISLVNLHPCALGVDMPNLEKIVIKATSQSGPGGNWRQRRPEWPALKALDITVDSKYGRSSDWSTPGGLVHEKTETKVLFHFFFQDVCRPTLIELRLIFTKETRELAIPKMDEIVTSCPNLKKLTLRNWPGTNKSLTKLFEGLTALEEISLEYCKGLGNVAFVGLDTRSPIILKLSKLKKLSLKGLDQMPKITDLLFSMVIRHLKLSSLALTSDFPVKSVTAHGVRSLLGGTFDETVDKFSFLDWSLANVSIEDFKKLESEFRCYNML